MGGMPQSPIGDQRCNLTTNKPPGTQGFHARHSKLRKEKELHNIMRNCTVKKIPVQKIKRKIGMFSLAFDLKGIGLDRYLKKLARVEFAVFPLNEVLF